MQDGGAVLGWSYFDLMARIKTKGPDDAWQRLKAILVWSDEVQRAGGYRKYYDAPGRGTLQGSGTPGGLGLDAEFLESVLVPQVMLYGFLGVQPHPGGLRIAPRLPADWPELTVTNVHIQHLVADLKATPASIQIHAVRGDTQTPLQLWLETGRWQKEPLQADGQPAGPAEVISLPDADHPMSLDFRTAPVFRLRRLQNSGCQIPDSGFRIPDAAY